MTKMQATESKSHSVNAYLSLTMVNDKLQSIESKSHSVVNAFLSLTVVNDKYALNTECDLNSVASIFVIDHSQ